MLNFRVADLDEMISQLKSAGIEVSQENEMEGIGRFARIHDPRGERDRALGTRFVSIKRWEIRQDDYRYPTCRKRLR